MTEPPPSASPHPDELAEQLAKTAADLRTLGEQLGAVPHASPKVMTLRRARITFLVVVAISALVGWFLWEHWHSLLVATAPLIWIISHSLGWRRNTRPTSEQSKESGG